MPSILDSFTPAGIAQGVIGLGQAIFGGGQARKAQKQLENLQTPTYTQNRSILDYYNKALQKYNVNPYQSNQYRTATQNADRSTAAGINALQSRGSAIGGISRLAAISNDAKLKAGVAAENEQNAALGQLGNAAGMRAGEDRMAFQYNQLAPYEKKYNLLAAKAQGGNQLMNAGMSNIFGSFAGASDMAMANKYYGNNSTKGGSGYSFQLGGY